MSRPRPVRYLWAALVLILLAIPVMLVLGLSGDCSPAIENCGEGKRQIGLGLLIAASLAFAYLIYKFVQSSRTR